MSYTRRLPHIIPTGETFFITWHLYGSLPRERYPPPGKINSGTAFVWMDQFLDAAREGPQWLRREEIAKIVEDALHQKDSDLHAYAIMPNHVHVLLTPKIELPKFNAIYQRQKCERSQQNLRHLW